VYVASTDYNLYAFNATTGGLIWKYYTGSELYNPPAVAAGVVYLNGNYLYALNAATGALLWTAAASGNSSPVVANGVVYIEGEAFDAATGAVLWGAPGTQLVNSSAAVVNGVAYIQAVDSGLIAYALPNGGPRPPARPDPVTLGPH
jgi:outer membrane protein assembly factor BamB